MFVTLLSCLLHRLSSLISNIMINKTTLPQFTGQLRGNTIILFYMGHIISFNNIIYTAQGRILNRSLFAVMILQSG